MDPLGNRDYTHLALSAVTEQTLQKEIALDFRQIIKAFPAPNVNYAISERSIVRLQHQDGETPQDTQLDLWLDICLGLLLSHGHDRQPSTRQGQRELQTSTRGSECQIFKVSGPKTVRGMVWRTRDLIYWVLGPSRSCNLDKSGLLVLEAW